MAPGKTSTTKATSNAAGKSERDEGDFPRTWYFNEDGLSVDGRYVEFTEGGTANGPCPIIVLQVDGEDRSVWLFHTALRSRFADEIARRKDGDLVLGERVLIRQGEMKEGANGRKYQSYVVRLHEAPGGRRRTCSARRHLWPTRRPRRPRRMTVSPSSQDTVGTGIASVPTVLSASKWLRWRAANPPAWLQPENRRGSRCGACGGELGTITRICVECFRRDAP